MDAMEANLAYNEPRPTHLLCEEERIQRLAERMRRDPAESAELARERRAHLMAREVRQGGFSRSPTRGHASVTSPSQGEFDSTASDEKRPTTAVPALSPPARGQRATLSGLSDASASEVLAGLKRELDKVEAALNRQEKGSVQEASLAKSAQVSRPVTPIVAEDELEEGADLALVTTSSLVAVDSHSTSSEAHPAGQHSSALDEVTLQRVHPSDRLSAALEDITVKGILELRSLPEVPAAVVAVAVAVLRLLDSQHMMTVATGLDQTLKWPEGPVTSWAEAKQILTKPGHFVNALRRFTYAADRGQVPETDICEAEEVLAEVPRHGQGLAEVHPVAARLHTWILAALEYAAWSRSRLEGIASTASPARAVRTPSRAALGPSTAMAPAATSAIDFPAQAAVSHGESPREMPVVPPSRLPRPPARPPTQVPVVTAAAPTATPSAVGRGAGFGVAWSALALEEEEEGSADPHIGAPPPALARRVEGYGSRLQSSPASSPARGHGSRLQSHSSADSPVRSPRTSPQPLSPRQYSDVAMKGAPAPRASNNSMTLPPSAPDKSSGSRRAQPASSPQRGVARVAAGATSPRASPTRGQTASGRAVRGSPARPGALASARGLSSSKASASSPALLPQQPPTLLASTLPTGQLPQGEVEEYKKKLEETKKEVRDIRALEAKLRWGMQREEKRQVVEERKEADIEIMQWREDLALGMKEYAIEKAQEVRMQELRESKDFHVFKRDAKQVAKEEELLHIQEQLKADIEHAEMQAEMAQAVVADRHALVLERMEDVQDLREIRASEELREKAEVEENRVHEVRLEFEHQAKQLSSQKEELLRNLHMLRSTKQRMPPGTRMGQVSHRERPRSLRAGR